MRESVGTLSRPRSAQHDHGYSLNSHTCFYDVVNSDKSYQKVAGFGFVRVENIVRPCGLNQETLAK